MLVGVQGIGKTSLLNQLRKEDKTGSVKNKVATQCNVGQFKLNSKDDTLYFVMMCYFIVVDQNI